MVGIDDIIVAIILISVLGGSIRGLVRDAISLMSWVLASVLGIVFAVPLSAWGIFEKTGHSVNIRVAAAFAVIFGIVLSLGLVVNWMAARHVRGFINKGLDHVLGAVFGYLRGVLVIVLVILLAHSTSIPESEEWAASAWIRYYQGWAVQATRWMPVQAASYFKWEAGQ